MTSIYFFIKVVFISNYFVMLCEFLYSKYRKDNVYDAHATLNNVLNGFVLYTISPRCYGIYLVFFFKYYNILHFGETQHFTFLAFILCLLFVDFMYYIFHRLHHNISFFWVLHSVHHSDKFFNLSTSNRISWFEQIYVYLFFIPVLLAGFHPLLIFFSFYVLSEYQFYCHSQYFKFPKFLNYFLVTPYNHKTHHDEDYKYQGSNFGGIFCIWDRLFKTYTEHPPKNFKPGVKNLHEVNFLRFEFVPMINFYRKMKIKYGKNN